MSAAASQVLLAETWSEDIDPTGWWMSEKLDGVRYKYFCFDYFVNIILEHIGVEVTFILVKEIYFMCRISSRPPFQKYH
jgi:hypothetical protein